LRSLRKEEKAVWPRVVGGGTQSARVRRNTKTVTRLLKDGKKRDSKHSVLKKGERRADITELMGKSHF